MPSAYLNSYMLMVARRLDTVDDQAEITDMLDELEFQLDALDPEYQQPVMLLIQRLREKLEKIQ